MVGSDRGGDGGSPKGHVAVASTTQTSAMRAAYEKTMKDLGLQNIHLPEFTANDRAFAKVMCGGLVLYLACMIPVVVVSCVTTRTCDVGDVLGPTDHCQEYGVGEKPIITSGDTCTVVCGGKEAGKRYFEPVLECDDGDLVDVSTGLAASAVCMQRAATLADLAEEDRMAQFSDANQPANVLLTGNCLGATTREIANINPAVPCVEGKFIAPGKTCTVNCASGYFPTIEKQTCRRPEMLLQPLHSSILCLVQSELIAWRAEMRAKPCFRDQHCSGHGVGSRNQTSLECDCTCDLSFAGKSCEIEVRECLLPEIANAAKPPCLEGWTTYVRGPTCTVACAEDYFPAIYGGASCPVLRCTATNLVPPSGECRGGPMPPTVCVVATGTLTGLYVFFIVVVFCLHKWRNWRVKLDLTKVYAGDPKCTMVAEEGHYSGGQTNVMKASQSARQYQRDKRAKLPWYQTDPRTGEVVVADERLDLNHKTESEQRRELKRLSELADLSRTIVKEVPLIESAYMSAYEGFLVEENYESASKLVREGYLLDAELDELEEERLVDEVMREKERKEAEDFEKRNPVFQVEDGEEPDTLLLMAPTDQRYAVDHSGLPIRDRHTGGTDVRYQAPLIENSEMPSLVEQSEWLNDYHKKESEEKSEVRLKESCLEILARYENGKAEEMALKQLEAATPVLERAKAIADAIDCWPLNKRCRGMMKKVTALREEAQAELDAAVELLMKSVATKDPAKIEEAIEQTKMIHDKYPALIGRWHMVGREVATEVVRRTAKEVSVLEKQKKKQMGMIADYDIGPAEMISAVKSKDVPKVRAGLNAFVSPNTRDPDTGMTLLHLAAVNFTPEVMMLLVQKKADVKMLTSEEYDVWDVASSFVRGFMKHKLKIKVPEGRVFPEDDENSINASTGGGKKMKAASGTQESLGGSKDSDKGGKEGEEKAEKSPRRSKMKRSGSAEKLEKPP